jgi:uncharacterized protein YndB with AHSA1/START domain
MADILHRIGALAPLDDVRRALTTTSGLAAWWTTDTSGDAEVGGKLAFRFSEVGGFDMEVLESSPATVRWRVIDGPADWVGTEIAFHLEQCGDYTVLRFHHQGWAEPTEFMHHCSTKWATFLMSLKELVETGSGHPHPHDIRISDWH